MTIRNVKVLVCFQAMAAIGLVFSGASALAQDAPRVVTLDQGNTGLKDAKSYALGWKVGKDMSGAGLDDKDFDAKEFTDGFMDALTKKAKLNDEQLKAAFMALQERIQKKMIESGRKNLEKANEFLKSNKEADGVQTTKSGLQYRVVKA
ncbi:MAG: FKBP-type peptidyl-prolyl cis-trans isomerase N-terminal domain-containing protein, partial [Pirellula sp.]